MFYKGIQNLIFGYIFALKTMSLPRKIKEQCGLCPTKSWSNADFAPNNPRAFVLCPEKCPRLNFLPRETMEQYFYVYGTFIAKRLKL